MPEVISHTLGFPRMGAQRELKKVLESYWAGKASEEELRAVGSELRHRHWAEQDKRGMRFITAGDFAWYDNTLATSFLLGNIAPRHRDGDINLDTLFRAGRGRAPTGQPASAVEMTKWFNTNYHYMVPEFTSASQTFSVTWRQLFDEVREAAAVYGAQRVKPVLLGPVSYLHLGKVKGDEKFDRIALLPNLVKAYASILEELASIGVEWVQIDEPALVLDLEEPWQRAYSAAYTQLRAAAAASPKLLLTTYFDSVRHHLDVIAQLPVDGLHVDLVNGDDSVATVEQALPKSWVLSAGVISGRNVWRTDLSAWYPPLREVVGKHRQLWVATSCSLLHCPVDLEHETLLDAELKSWLAFALQKCDELHLLARALNDDGEATQQAVAAYSEPVLARQKSDRVVRADVRARVQRLTAADSARSEPFPARREKQRERFNLPLWPTTTIGSFPQTPSIRTQRQSFRKGLTDEATYNEQLREHIAFAVREQERLDLDVLVHGEAERSDMVEYFGELLDGFAFTQNGWVQSYGSRCVKPPIIYGDVSRPRAMTVSWSAYAQSLTKRPMKGMLTGPVTILCWSFPREDVTREHISQQLALALRDEVADLEAAGIPMIQVDEPALREGMPLQKHKWAEYLDWAARVFRIAVSVAKPATQVHTHMCYAEVNDIMSTIVAMDADVISLEASRSGMELLDAFEHFTYPNEIGPGVYDIHSPNIPSVESIVALLRSAATRVPVDQLWVNPDCGLKTRTWKEVSEALTNMVAAAKELRANK
ncbi:putative 5-methyltetrahydropteroyltriglutamate-homocysteine S-methyltransferase [Leptomonas pyrrhocoris]|uniref:5-methyltetrahydropteroyltriglutamate--homocysteine S-methyltransferase n=1 Tax=Leptomonas pyrrhocoris TaxID=157538 RepID=A0A0M9FUG2_LEPPY|nr:putative 5-methyltetrahydropteroyltriglutamate-homocysteine S-methyltransferase [Leptomonas pyrrhocoris]KPA76325.1 putative 5-methyltetrahydropteroyltriglutamate-homocysteine S-methyltransferase [Leptomonas pyrrhocoris]|eukprot:XP_015654764.1 putative 5-methyltetrahydropteroyltriglutamate-homocysteine S-methyltransferase [Leptomonas pyrrhocoris]